MKTELLVKKKYSSFKLKDEEFIIVPKKDFEDDKNSEKIILRNFLKSIFEKDLKIQGYDNQGVNDFISSYLDSFNKSNLVSI